MAQPQQHATRENRMRRTLGLVFIGMLLMGAQSAWALANPASVFCAKSGGKHGIDLMPVLIHDGDEPALPASPRHHLAVPELAREHHRLLTRRGIARQVHSFRIVDAFLPIGDMKVVTRHRVLAPPGEGSPAVHAFGGARKPPFASARPAAVFMPTCDDRRRLAPPT
jgi:hypothetical protein